MKNRTGWLTLFGSTAALSVQHLASAKTNGLGGDETAVLWVWNHRYLSRDYFAAIASHTMAPPADFIIGGAWWRLLNFFFPFWCHLNLELAVRTYSNLVMSLATFFLGACLFLITESWLLSLILLIFFTKTSVMVNFYYSEVRFYPALYLWTVLCWFFYLRVVKALTEDQPLAAPSAVFFISCAIGVWFHIYVIFTTFGLLTVFLISLWKETKWEILKKNLAARWSLFSVLLSYAVLLFYIVRYANRPGPLTFPNILAFPWESEWSLWKSAMQDIYGIDIRWFLGILLILFLVSLRSSDRKRIMNRTWVVLGAGLGSVLALLSQGQQHYTWGGRYLLFMFPNGVLLLGNLLRDPVRHALVKLPRYSGIVIPLTAIITFWIVPTLNGKEWIPNGGDQWVRTRKEIFQHRWQVVGVLGIHPAADRSMAALENGTWVGMRWELYANGMRRLPSIHDYGESKKNAGLILLSCAEQKNFAPIPDVKTLRLDQQVYIDYCGGVRPVTPK